MTAHNDDREALRLALALLKHTTLGDRDLAVRLINGTDLAWTRRLLIAQTDNAARLFDALYRPPTEKLARDLGVETDALIRGQFDTLILGMAGETETEQG